MTGEETIDFVRKYSAAFPSFGEWLRALPNSQATIDTWKKTLASTPMAYALQVLDLMLEGKRDVPTGWERDLTALKVRAYAERLVIDERRRSENRAPARDERGMQDRGAGLVSHMREAVRVGERVKAAGVDELFSRQRMSELLNAVRSLREDQEPRLRCVTCRDTGIVEIWHPKHVAEHKKGRLTKPYKTAVAACGCVAGKRYGEPLGVVAGKQIVACVKYDPSKDCAIDNGVLDPEVLAQWFNECIKHMPNYEPGFAEYA